MCMPLMLSATVKAFAEVALGMSMYHLYAHLRGKKLHPLWEVALTVLMLFAIYRYFALTIKANSGLDNFRRIVYIMIFILLSFLNKDLITSVLNHGFSRFLGSISMTMYVCHYTLCNYYFAVVNALAKNNPTSGFLQGLTGSSAMGFSSYGGGTINWSIRITYILCVIVIAVIIHCLVKLIAKKMGIDDVKIKFEGFRKSDPERRLLNTDKIRARTNWKPVVTLDEGLEMCVKSIER